MKKNGKWMKGKTDRENGERGKSVRKQEKRGRGRIERKERGRKQSREKKTKRHFDDKNDKMNEGEEDLAGRNGGFARDKRGWREEKRKGELPKRKMEKG